MMSESQSQQSNESQSSTRRRVKLYALNADRQWDDRGTGHVTSLYIDRLKGQSLLVRAENDGSVLLESLIMQDTAYQKQQETLIVWSEGDNYDLALSFQEKVGCDEIWEKICLVQGKDPSLDITQDIQDDDDDNGSMNISKSNDQMEHLKVELPKQVNESSLDDILKQLQLALQFSVKREKIALQIEHENYIEKLIELFKRLEADGKKDLKSLNKLFEIIKTIFLLNKNPLFEVLLSDDNLWSVIGMLEYESPTELPTKCHRNYLKNISQFKQIIKFNSQEIITKIHQTYRVQYIQDVILPIQSVFEENLLSTMTSFIFFNKVEIVSMIQSDHEFLQSFFSALNQSSLDPMNPSSIELTHDLVNFLKEFCLFSQTLQPQNRESFFKSLQSFGILTSLQSLIELDDEQVKLSVIEIILYFTEFSSQTIRESILCQSQSHAAPSNSNTTNNNNNNNSKSLLIVLIEQMNNRKYDLSSQIGQIIKLLLDPESMMSSSSMKCEFLSYFYKSCIQVMLQPIDRFAQGSADGSHDDSPGQLNCLIELLTFCIEHHIYYIRNYILSCDLIKKITLIMEQTRHKFLCLSALRFIRKIIQLKDEFYNRFLIQSNVFRSIVKVFESNKSKYNLLESAILELFEFIKNEEIKSLNGHFNEKFIHKFDDINYVKTFKQMKLQFQQQKQQQNSIQASSIDLNEDIWFNEDDDDDDDDDHNLHDQDDDDALDQQFNEFNQNIIKSRANKQVTVQCATKRSLVDYDDEDSDEEHDDDERDEDNSNENGVKRIKFS